MDGHYCDEHGFYWVRDMVALCQHKAVQQVPLGTLQHNMGYCCWSSGEPHRIMRDQDPERYTRHKQRIANADLAYPLIVTSDNYDVLDGMHRLCRAIQLNWREVPCVLMTRAEMRSLRRYAPPSITATQ